TIVNIERIRDLEPWFNGDYVVTLRDGTKLTLSASYRSVLKALRKPTVPGEPRAADVDGAPFPSPGEH
ncbi:MAG TPA: LytTR family DNA-binding domain-containing protein, partial [Thermoanaerobaculia bacterium]|nr:LytTR family DNA-binding domain-containing protein [Thermoanaerobaculia bacterium]